MQEYPIPLDEEARLATLESTGAIRRSGDAVLDHAVALVRHIMDAPVALVSMVAHESQHFIARCGIDMDSTSREASICTHAIMRRHALVIHDAEVDPRTRSNPLVLGAPFIRFYAGAPIILSTGVRLGAVCAIDFQPRVDVDPQALIALQSLAAMVARHLEKLDDQKSAQARIDEALNGARREVLSLVSQELRAPAAVMRDAAKLDQDGAHALSRDGLASSAEQLEQLADRIASFANAIPNGLGLEEAGVCLDALLARCCAMAAPDAAARRLAVTRDTPAGLKVVADEVHLTNAVFALLRGAMTAAERQVSVSARTGRDGEIVIEITHDGPAPATDRDPSLKGLPLARSLAALHGGAVWAGDDARDRACMVVTLPAWRRVAPLATETAA